MQTIYSSLHESSEKGGGVDVAPLETRKLLHALSKSGIPHLTKLQLSDMSRKVWEDWKVNIDDIGKLNGDLKRIGKGRKTDVYLDLMKLRNEKDNIIEGKFREVAVKQFVLISSHTKEQFPIFIREVFLQRHAYHPCVFRSFRKSSGSSRSIGSGVSGTKTSRKDRGEGEPYSNR